MNAIHPRCPVCSQDISGHIVRCSRCDTSYHTDCWTFGGECAIYGCKKTEPRVAPPKAYPDELTRRDRLRGGLFGATLGAGLTLVTWPFLGYVLMQPRVKPIELALTGLGWSLCAALLGWRTGTTVRGRVDRTRTLMLAVFGPAAAAFSVCVLAASVVYFPFFMMFSLPAVAFALPCALVAERFNENALANRGAQDRMLSVVKVLVAIGALATLAMASMF